MFQINHDFRGANISRTIRFTEKLFAQLNTTAKENNISFNLLVLQCCKYAMENISLQYTPIQKNENAEKPPTFSR